MTRPEERCIECDEPTGRAGAGDDSLYVNGDGPYCEDCYSIKELPASLPRAANPSNSSNSCSANELLQAIVDAMRFDANSEGGWARRIEYFLKNATPNPPAGAERATEAVVPTYTDDTSLMLEFREPNGQGEDVAGEEAPGS